MRSLGDIVEYAKDGQMPTHEECYWAMLALNAIAFFDQRALSDLANRPNKIMTPEWQWKESWNRWKKALDQDPKVYIGWNNDPSNPDCQAMRGVAKKLMDKALNGELEPITEKLKEDLRKRGREV